MAESIKPTSSVAGTWEPENRPAKVVGDIRLRAIVMGGVLGASAGWYCAAVVVVPAVRSESLAALPVAPRQRVIARGHDGSIEDSGLHPPQPTPDAASPVTGARLKSDGPVGDAGDEWPCGEGMRLVDGDYCATLVHRCTEPFSDGSGRCRRFADGARCYPPVIAMHYCIDEFEYPNRRDEKPKVMVSFVEAKSLCANANKRLCTAREWTLACEGPDRLPYPNGRVRDRLACNIDQPHRFPSVEALNDPSAVEQEVKRLDQRTPSGSMPGCVSQFGVHDMVGNVDEWVIPDGPEEAAGLGAKTALKGGYFGAVRARCRPTTPSHGSTFRFYQVGFRCCRDMAVDAGTRR